MVMKLVIGTKSGKCLQKEIEEGKEEQFAGLKIGDKLSGDSVGLAGYEFQITGGSDQCGFPMRRDIEGTERQKVLAISGIGQKKKANGIRYRKTIAGNTVHEKTAQINLKILKEGSEPLFAPEEKAEEKPEAPAESKAEEKPEVPAEKTKEKKE